MNSEIEALREIFDIYFSTFQAGSYSQRILLGVVSEQLCIVSYHSPFSMVESQLVTRPYSPFGGKSSRQTAARTCVQHLTYP